MNEHVRPDPDAPGAAPVEPVVSLTDAPALIARAISEAKSLASAELSLAKTEMKENLGKATGGIVFGVIALFMVFVALNAFIFAAVYGMFALGMPLWLAGLLTGIGFLVLAAIFGAIAARRLSASTLTPRRTIEQVRKDIKTMEEAAHGHPA